MISIYGGTSNSALDYYSVTATANTTTTSATPVALNAMTLTPPAGTYFVFFSTYTVQSAFDHTFLQLYIDAVAEAATLKQATGREATTLGTNPIFNPSAIISVVTVNGSQAINIRWWTSGATATCHQRELHVLRITP